MKKVISFIAMTLLAMPAFAAETLSFKVYNPQDKSIFPVSSTVIYGDKEAILIDAQFQKNDAENVVQMIKETGKNLTTIYISDSDPDFYFGLDTIIKNFPNAKVVATPETADIISQTQASKLNIWQGALKDNAPARLITPQPIIEKTLLVDGHEIIIKQDSQDPDHSYLWVPSIKMIVGGVSVSDGIYVWLADTQEKSEASQWLAKLDEMKALVPEIVIPGHFVKRNEPYSPQAIDFTRTYIVDFENAVQSAKTSADIIKVMTAKYSHLQGISSLEISAKVATGEIEWSVIHSNLKGTKTEG